MIVPLLIDGKKIPTLSRVQLSQTYEVFGGGTIRRFINGAGVKQNNWDKLKTQISGSGIVPPGLDQMSIAGEITLSCISERAYHTTSLTPTLPRTPRTDYPPRVRAYTDDGYVETDAVTVGSDVTITAVGGADFYVVSYYPVMTVLLAGTSTAEDNNGAEYSWSIEFEEV